MSGKTARLVRKMTKEMGFDINSKGGRTFYKRMKREFKLYRRLKSAEVR